MLSDLHNEFTRRFKDFHIISKDLQLVSLPFILNINDVQPYVLLEFINLQSNLMLKNKFDKKNSKVLYFLKSRSVSKYSGNIWHSLNQHTFANYILELKFGSSSTNSHQLILSKFE